MTTFFTPFTPEEFRNQTGLHAADNEAIYIRWVNTHINYANYQTLQQMATSLKEICSLLKDPAMVEEGKYPFTK
jgi:ribonuclease HI